MFTFVLELGVVHRTESLLQVDSPVESVDSATGDAPPIAISKRDAGGVAPIPLHSIFPPQSAVSHLPTPVASNVHPVLAHTLPDHAGFVGICALWPEFNWNPDVGSRVVPAPESVAGHIVKGQLLVMVKRAAEQQEINKNGKRKMKVVDVG
ncbi:hypothetical protein L1887_28089 [Cichorium endivia]|nr:hypothetical protein L1887_28089 [Cichorium endivia]